MSVFLCSFPARSQSRRRVDLLRVVCLLIVPCMPPSKKSPEERAAAHVLRAQSIRYEAQSRAIHTWLRSRPDLIPDVHAHLSALLNGGQSNAGGDARAVPVPDSGARVPLALPWVSAGGAVVPGPATAAAATATASRESAPLGAGVEMDGKETQTQNNDVIAPHNYSFAAMSVQNLKSLLECLDQRVFNRFNIKQISVKGEAKRNKQMLLEILEFATNVAVNGSPDCRTWSELKEVLVKKYIYLGSRAAELPLPPKWSDDGVYSLSMEEDGKMKIKHNFLADHPERILDLPTGWSAERVMLVDNFSESGAYLSDPRVEGMPVKLMTLFDSTALNTSRPRLRRPPSSSSFTTDSERKAKRPSSLQSCAEFPVLPKKLCFEGVKDEGQEENFVIEKEQAGAEPGIGSKEVVVDGYGEPPSPEDED